jgi:hypothetical protein
MHGRVFGQPIGRKSVSGILSPSQENTCLYYRQKIPGAIYATWWSHSDELTDSEHKSGNKSCSKVTAFSTLVISACPFAGVIQPLLPKAT